jgi:hypothetical protein
LCRGWVLAEEVQLGDCRRVDSAALTLDHLVQPFEVVLTSHAEVDEDLVVGPATVR